MLTAFNRNNSGVNVVTPNKYRIYSRLTGKQAELMAFKGKNSGVNGVEPEK